MPTPRWGRRRQDVLHDGPFHANGCGRGDRRRARSPATSPWSVEAGPGPSISCRERRTPTRPFVVGTVPLRSRDGRAAAGALAERAVHGHVVQDTSTRSCGADLDGYEHADVARDPLRPGKAMRSAARSPVGGWRSCCEGRPGARPGLAGRRLSKTIDTYAVVRAPHVCTRDLGVERHAHGEDRGPGNVRAAARGRGCAGDHQLAALPGAGPATAMRLSRTRPRSGRCRCGPVVGCTPGQEDGAGSRSGR